MPATYQIYYMIGWKYHESQVTVRSIVFLVGLGFHLLFIVYLLRVGGVFQYKTACRGSLGLHIYLFLMSLIFLINFRQDQLKEVLQLCHLESLEK